ncbi:YiiD C-terminal domain-containing protein [Rheinheimera sp. WS51]|uniref:bifunctional GNAT family N-acetyltransferase/hotdog fold thioesterase n=1 Tax=Rheinheimera sp. WS51 TaxID=3425886 RepID=UPI003D8CC86F
MKHWQLREPQTSQEWQQYYQLRWQVLRQPWQQPQGSEQDSLDAKAYHLLLINDAGDIAAVGRIHQCQDKTAQIRYMAVAEAYRGKGAGRRILQGLEQQAVLWQCVSVILNARESAIGFYQGLGYQAKEEAEALFGIAHTKMAKVIKLEASKQVFGQWCQQLGQTWQQTIPMSQYMQISINGFDGNTFSCQAPLAPNINLHQTMFAGSIYTLATLTGWGMLFLQLQAQNLSGDMVLAEGNIRYFAPVSIHPATRCQLQHCIGDLSPLASGKKVSQSITVAVLSDNKVAAEFKGRYVVLPKKASQ